MACAIFLDSFVFEQRRPVESLVVWDSLCLTGCVLWIRSFDAACSIAQDLEAIGNTALFLHAQCSSTSEHSGSGARQKICRVGNG